MKTVVNTIPDLVMRRARSKPRGSWVFTAKDFLDLGQRDAVDQALSRLARAGQIRRLTRGLYDLPRSSRVLNALVPVQIEAAVDAIARRDDIRILPDGLTAAHQLGLTNAVPAKVQYITDGRSRTIKVGGRSIYLRHAAPSVMAWANRTSAAVVQALRWLGRDMGTDPSVLEILRRSVSDDIKTELVRHQLQLPAWMRPVVAHLADHRTAA